MNPCRHKEVIGTFEVPTVTDHESTSAQRRAAKAELGKAAALRKMSSIRTLPVCPESGQPLEVIGCDDLTLRYRCEGRGSKNVFGEHVPGVRTAGLKLYTCDRSKWYREERVPKKPAFDSDIAAEDHARAELQEGVLYSLAENRQFLKKWMRPGSPSLQRPDTDHKIRFPDDTPEEVKQQLAQLEKGFQEHERQQARDFILHETKSSRWERVGALCRDKALGCVICIEPDDPIKVAAFLREHLKKPGAWFIDDPGEGYGVSVYDKGRFQVRITDKGDFILSSGFCYGIGDKSFQITDEPGNYIRIGYREGTE